MMNDHSKPIWIYPIPPSLFLPNMRLFLEFNIETESHFMILKKVVQKTLVNQ